MRTTWAIRHVCAARLCLSFVICIIRALIFRGAQTDEYLTVKQCASVAHQYDRSMTISEGLWLHWLGAGFSTQKWLGDWRSRLGITRRCQHLCTVFHYWMQKEDYPPVFNYQNTWWDDNDKMENYFGRLALCLSQGDRCERC